MPKPYPIDLRGRVVEEVESGASRREAAERHGLSPSVVVLCQEGAKAPCCTRDEGGPFGAAL